MTGDVKTYLEDIRHIIHINSPAQLKMFAMRHKDKDPNLGLLLDFDRATLKLYLYYLRKHVLPFIEEQLNYITDDPIH